MLILAVYPFLLILMLGLMIAKRKSSPGSLPLFTQFTLFLCFLMPWLLILTTIIKGDYPDISIGASQLTKNADLWLLGTQGMLALVLILIKKSVASNEAWLKSLISFFFGILFLQLSLHPSAGLWFPINTEIAQCITAVSFITGILFLFGLPPLQLGAVDLGSEKNPSLSLVVNLLLRLAMAFVVLFTMSFANWLGDLSSLHGLVVGSLFLAVALSRLVLRLQTNVFRTFSYLTSGLAIPIAVKVLIPDLSDIFLFVQFLMLLPLVLALYDEPTHESSGRHRLNWASFRAYNQEAAFRFHSGLKSFLYMECLWTLSFSVFLITKAHWFVAIAALIASFSALVVTQDKQAFAPHSAA